MRYIFLDESLEKGKTEPDAMCAYVIEDFFTHQVTDFFSFYLVPKIQCKHFGPEIDNIKACHQYYFAAKGHDIETLVKVSLAKA